jgi:DNA-binding Lrp family transcriptional regulator
MAMPKTSREQIDKDEKKVMRELIKNSDESVDTIAKKCGFSRQKVWRIIKRLEKNKTIWGYTAIVDEKKIERKSFVLFIKGKHLPIENSMEKNIISREIDKIASKIDVLIEESYWLHGVFDGMVCFSAKNLKHAKNFYELFITTYGEDLAELELSEKIVTIKKCGFVNPKILQTKKLLKS